MVCRIAILYGLFAATALARLDLTPVAADYEIDGVKRPCLAFHDGSRRVTYTPPAAWQRSGNPEILRLSPPNATYEVATLEVVMFPEPMQIAKQSLDAHSSLAKTMVPQGATNVEVLESTFEPLRICGHLTIETTLRYNLFGVEFKMSVLFLARDREQLRCTLTARVSEFPKLHETFRETLYSIRGL